jgi:hypothetical protein
MAKMSDQSPLIFYYFLIVNNILIIFFNGTLVPFMAIAPFWPSTGDLSYPNELKRIYSQKKIVKLVP